MGANIKNKQISGKKIEIYGKMKIARLITLKCCGGSDVRKMVILCDTTPGRHWILSNS